MQIRMGMQWEWEWDKDKDKDRMGIYTECFFGYLLL